MKTILVGGLNHLEKYESQWKDDIPYIYNYINNYIYIYN